MKRHLDFVFQGPCFITSAQYLQCTLLSFV